MVWKTNNQAEVQEGEEVRAGVPVVDVVNPKAMRVRARVNQADINDLQVGQTVKIGLDAYPELSFDGRIAQISPVGVVSTLSPKARVYRRADRRQRLAPEPHARSDGLARRDAGAPARRARRAARRDRHRTARRAFVRVKSGSSYQEQPVTVGATSALDAVVTSGVAEGAVVARNVDARAVRGRRQAGRHGAGTQQ